MGATGRLAGHTALVTGASRGIGLGIAREFAKEGANLAIVATNESKLSEASDELRALGAEVEAIVADVGDRAACEQAFKRAVDRFGRIEILVNSAATYKAAPFLGYATDDFHRLLQVNLFGVIHMMQFALPHMLERNYGRVINVASTAGKWASVNQSAYNISKHAVVGLTRCAAVEHAAHGITVNAICPGMVQTDLSDQFIREHAALNKIDPGLVREDLIRRIAERRFLDVSEVGSFAVYLASREAQGMTGQSVLLDGGMLYV